jgi:2-keto-3-deoxy-L-fuconate dehydrogenase
VRLKNKTALVTAAGQGIGRASATGAGGRGRAGLGHRRQSEALLATATRASPGIQAAKLDVLDKAAIDAFAKTLPTLDILFNCAGVVHNGAALQASDDDLDFAFRLNVRAQFWLIQAVLPGMLAAGRGSIINMASVCSSIKGLPNRCVYGTTKAAVLGLTKSVAADYVGQGIRCNAVCPGTVDTPSLGERINANADPVEARKAFIARQPMGRLAQAEEIAPLVVFLASDESQFVTGQAYAADGGITI